MYSRPVSGPKTGIQKILPGVNTPRRVSNPRYIRSRGSHERKNLEKLPGAFTAPEHFGRRAVGKPILRVSERNQYSVN